jgi:hypothetical protein
LVLPDNAIKESSYRIAATKKTMATECQVKDHDKYGTS